MKWLVLVLLLVNGFVWFAGDFWVPDSTSSVVTAQTLPRVSTLKVDDRVRDPDETERVVDVEIDSGEPKPELEPVTVVERQCIRLGWFETAEEARNAYRSLGSPGEAFQVSEEERDLEPLHWVIIPPQPEDRALRLFNDLQRRGIDSYLVTRGENRNAISLGLFQSKEAAERVLETKKSQNLNAVLANFPRNQLSYALVFEVPPDSNANTGDRRISDYQDDFEMVEISRC